MGSAAQCGDPKPAVEQWGPAGSPRPQDYFSAFFAFSS